MSYILNCSYIQSLPHNLTSALYISHIFKWSYIQNLFYKSCPKPCVYIIYWNAIQKLNNILCISKSSLQTNPKIVHVIYSNAEMFKMHSIKTDLCLMHIPMLVYSDIFYASRLIPCAPLIFCNARTFKFSFTQTGWYLVHIIHSKSVISCTYLIPVYSDGYQYGPVTMASGFWLLATRFAAYPGCRWAHLTKRLAFYAD